MSSSSIPVPGQRVRVALGGSVSGLHWLFVSQIAGGAVLGAIAYFIFVFAQIYLPFLTPILIGLGLGLTAREVIKKTGMDHTALIAGALILGGVVGMGTFHAGRYIDFTREIDARTESTLAAEVEKAKTMGRANNIDIFEETKKEFLQNNPPSSADADKSPDDRFMDFLRQLNRERILKSDEYFRVGGDTVGHYVDYQLQKGIVLRVAAGGKQQGFATLPPVSAAFYISEPVLVMIGGLFLVMPVLAAPRSFATRQRLTETRVLGRLDAGSYHALTEQFASGKAAELEPSLIVSPAITPAIEVTALSVPHREGAPAETHAVLDLQLVTQTITKEWKHRPIGRYWYPVETVAVVAERMSKHAPKTPTLPPTPETTAASAPPA